MPIFKCYKCEYKTNHKSHFNGHMNKQGPYCRTQILELNPTQFAAEHPTFKLEEVAVEDDEDDEEEEQEVVYHKPIQRQTWLNQTNRLSHDTRAHFKPEIKTNSPTRVFFV